MVKVEKKKRKRSKPISTLGIVKGQRHLEVVDKKVGRYFQKGNEWYLRRAKCGPDMLFDKPEQLWEEAVNYFQYVDANPWVEEDVAVNQGVLIRYEKDKKQPYTLTALLLYLGVSESFFQSIKTKAEQGGNPKFIALVGVIKAIEQVIYHQKFVGAATGFFNANIIARDLKLADSTDVTSGGKAFQTIPPAINVYNTAPPLAEAESNIDTPDKPESKRLKK